ncbi:MAG TPA: hypothetical protein VFW50_36490 [Streptosporangiaceae bacterium]|nr:hypothetical protein [Streptosporangiaceae bacterium]
MRASTAWRAASRSSTTSTLNPCSSSATTVAASISGPPPLGPGAPPLDRLIAYGQARVAFLIDHADVARATLDGGEPVPAGSRSPLSQLHIRMLLGQLDLGPADLDMLAIHLTAALDGPLLLYLSSTDLAVAPDWVGNRITHGWQDLVRRVARP